MSNKITELQATLVSKRDELEQMENTLSDMESDKLSHFEDEITSAWDDELNEMYGEQVDALPFYCGSAAQLCEDKDNTFYRCGLNDFADGFDVTSFDSYIELSDNISELEDEISTLEEELENEEDEE